MRPSGAQVTPTGVNGGSETTTSEVNPGSAKVCAWVLEVATRPTSVATSTAKALARREPAAWGVMVFRGFLREGYEQLACLTGKTQDD